VAEFLQINNTMKTGLTPFNDHDWQLWRRSGHEFAPSLFQNRAAAKMTIDRSIKS